MSFYIYIHALVAGLDSWQESTSLVTRRDYMAHTIETMVVEGREGKTRSQQLARLAEWKKAALANGADTVDIWEVGSGDNVGGWLVSVHHKSATALGAALDKYYKSPAKYDALGEKWQKSPTLNIKSYSVLHKMESM